MHITHRKHNILFKHASPEDAQKLAQSIRPIDAQEILYTSGLEPLDGINLSISMSPINYAVYTHDKILCIIGISQDSILSDRATIWALGSTHINTHKILFTRLSRPTLALLCSSLPPHVKILHNNVWSANSTALHWLTWLGATLQPVELITPPNAPNSPQLFYPFTIERI